MTNADSGDHPGSRGCGSRTNARIQGKLRGMFRLEFELCSFADLRAPGVLTRLGRALDSEPLLKLDRMDTHEPVRNMIASAEAYLSDGHELIAGREVLFERRRFPKLSGELSAPSYDDGTPEQQHRFHAEIADGDRDWLLEAENLDRFAAWFGRVADGFEACYGYAADHQMAHQQAGEFGRLRRERRWAPLPPGPESDMHSVRDVYWLNYFGPAYVEMWGGRIGGLGARRDATPNGGLVVWAIETPFVYEEGIGSFMDYAWKKPFYDALGLDTFVNAVKPSWVSNVPTRADHLRRTRATG